MTSRWWWIGWLSTSAAIACAKSEEAPAPDDVAPPTRDGGSGAFDASDVRDASAESDARADASPTSCAPLAALKKPQEVLGINSAAVSPSFSLSQDEKTIYFNRFDGRSSRKGIFRAKRADISGAFGGEESFFTDRGIFDPYLSADGTKLYVAQGTDSDLRVSFLGVAANGVLSGPTDIPSTKPVAAPYVSEADGALFVDATLDGTIGTLSAGEYRVVTELGIKQTTGGRSRHPVLSKDGKSVYFLVSDNSGVEALYFASRPTVPGPFGTPQPVTGLPKAPYLPAWLSGDGCRLYLANQVAGGWKVYVANTN